MNAQHAAALAEMLRESRCAVFFGGAGVSTESGIPDFRSQDGLYKQQWKYPPETILSHSFWRAHPEDFYRFYREKMLYPGAQPNKGHIALALLEEKGPLRAVITQNIDGLHQQAGSKNVIELHGSVKRNHCTRCGKSCSTEILSAQSGVPRCTCGGIIKPDVVLYEESLPGDAWERAAEVCSRADLMIVGGTSLTVYPASLFVQEFAGKLVIINRSPTAQDGRADLVINDSIGEVLSRAAELFLSA